MPGRRGRAGRQPAAIETDCRGLQDAFRHRLYGVAQGGGPLVSHRHDRQRLEGVRREPRSAVRSAIRVDRARLADGANPLGRARPGSPQTRGRGVSERSLRGSRVAVQHAYGVARFGGFGARHGLFLAAMPRVRGRSAARREDDRRALPFVGHPHAAEARRRRFHPDRVQRLESRRLKRRCCSGGKGPTARDC